MNIILIQSLLYHSGLNMADTNFENHVGSYGHIGLLH